MMKSWLPALLALVTLNLSTPSLAQECHKSFRIRGTGNDGRPKDFVLKFKRPLREPSSFNSVDQEAGDQRSYGQFYQIVGPPTHKQNCAGHVLNRLWGTGNTYFPASQFYSCFIQNFASEVTRRPLPDDVVVFFKNGTANHVAAVVAAAASPDLVEIESKDNQESIISGLLDRSRRNDPIVAKNGDFKIYRIKRRAVSVTEEASGECDVAPLTLTIEVNELLRGAFRQLANARVTLELLNGERVASKDSDNYGNAAIPLATQAPDKVEAARGGLRVTVLLKGYEQKSDTIPGDLLQKSMQTWSMTLVRTADNPAAADPNLPPQPNLMQLQDWRKNLDDIVARLAALEAKKAELLKKVSSAKSNVDRVDQVETKVRELLAELRKLKPAVDRVEQLCKDAAKANGQLEALEKAIRGKEKSAAVLTDELLKLTDNCASWNDVAKLREGTTRLRQTISEIGDLVKRARLHQDELKRLQTESLKELPELTKALGLRKNIGDQEDLAGQAFKAATADFGQSMKLESEIRLAGIALSNELFKLRSYYPGNVIPKQLEQQLDALDTRTNNLTKGFSTGQAATEIATKLTIIDDLTREADGVINQYQAAVCTIRMREDLLQNMAGSVTFAGLGLQSVLRVEPQIKQCEAWLDCQTQLAKIEEALAIGDLETSTQIISQIKGPGCDTFAVEARHQQIANRLSFPLASARSLWRDIAGHCNYRMAYEEALVIQKEFPKHPWIVKNFADIGRAWQVQQQIDALVDKLVIADLARNYEEAEKILAQIEQVVAPYPCLVAETEKLRAEYGRGKPERGNEETVRTCNELVARIQQAIAARNLVEAAQNLQQARQQCANVTPALFSDVGTAQQQLEQAVQQALNDLQITVSKCEYEEAFRLAQQLQQLNPSTKPASDMLQLQQQAEAQKNARQFLVPGLEAIKQKDISGAISSLRQALGVPGLPSCMRDNISKLLNELELRRNFMNLTEEVERATVRCDYKEAARVVGHIIRITPREQYITDWLTPNLQTLAELQNRERRALELIRQADTQAGQADAASVNEPVDWNRANTLIQAAMTLLTQADQEAPKCLPQRQQMEQVRLRLVELAKRKKPEIAASIVLLIDTSGSMGDNNKIHQAKEAARIAARQVSKTTEIAVLSFDGDCNAGAVKYRAPFTTSLNTLLAAIDGLAPGGGTPMYVATAIAVEYAQKGGGRQKNVILLSDGADTCSDQKARAVATIRASNIPVSTIGYDVGNNATAQNELGEIARLSGGRTFSASAADPHEIIRAVREAMLPSLLKLSDVGGSAAGHFVQAKAMVEQKNVSGALMQLQQASKLVPDSPNLNFNLSLLYESQDQLIPAMNHANMYLKLAPQAMDRADVETRIAEIQKELQRNPRALYDSSGCRDVLSWAQAEQEASKRARDVARRQAVLEILIASQRGECENARRSQAAYQQRYR